jgi:transcriptional regulator with XRE-family HTH domain
MTVILLNRIVTLPMMRARELLRMTQGEFGEALGVSKRTAHRWEAAGGQPSLSQVVTAARLVHPLDATLAAELAAAASETLESLGLVQRATPPAPAPPLPSRVVVQAVVCAAAEALGVAPGAVRGAVLAAFTCARELRLSVEEVEGALAPEPETKRRAAARGKP